MLSVSGLAQADFGFRTSEDEVYTLYRSSAVTNDPSLRVHVATFDSSDGGSYNKGNCEIAIDLFQKQPGVVVRYWCEKGYFTK